MSARHSSSFATVVFVVPLAAIPLMAVFGIPEFDQLSASTGELVPDIVRQPSMSFVDAEAGTTANSDRHRDRARDLLAPIEERAATPIVADDAPAGSREQTDAISATPNLGKPDPSVAPNPRPSPRPKQTAATPPAARRHGEEASYLPPEVTESGLSWNEATRRLTEMGITDYRLANHSSPDQFLFVCSFSPGGDARIVQRFEAEADEPLEAVENVLAQVGSWLQHRHQDSRQWLR